MPYFVLLLDLRSLIVWYVALCAYRQSVCVTGALVGVRSDGKHIQPHTAQTINEGKTAESNLVTTQSTAYEPPEDGRICGPKHVGVSSLKGFFYSFFFFFFKL
jgi:allophanate hydrolase subunit 2